MMVRHSQDEETGIWYREIVYRNYRKLADLGVKYQEKGFKTWINLWDCGNNEWLLTVELGVNYVK